MKTSLVSLQNSVSSTYDKTRTSALGRAFQKTIGGQQVIGPALTGFIDVNTVAGIAPGYVFFVPGQNLLFVLQQTTAAAASVAVFNFNASTGANSYIGRVVLHFANSAVTTTTHRGFIVWTDGTNVRIMISATGSVATNSGIYIAYCNLSQFTPGGFNLWAASGPGQNAIYLVQSNDYYGVTATTGFNSSQWGIAHPYLSPDSACNTKLYALANTVAAPSAMVWELATTPDVAGQVISGVTSFTALQTNTSPGAYLSSATLPGYSGTSGEPVVLLAGTAAVPTPLVAWAPGSVQSTANVFFTRDAQRLYTFTCTALTAGISANSTYTIVVGAQTLTFTVVTPASIGATSFVGTLALPAQPTNPSAPPSSGTLTRTAGTGDASITFSAAVAGNFFFNLSATSGGTAVVLTQALAGFSMVRAFGTSNNQFVGRTPIAGFLPALSGTLLQSNVLNYARPISAPQNTALNNQCCLATATSTNLYLGRISDLIVLSTTGNTTVGSTSVTGMASTAGLAAGMSVVGSAIPAGVTITAVGVGTVTLSAGANSTTTGSSLVFGTNNWASLTASNALGSGIDMVAPTIAFSRYGASNTANDVDRFVYATGTSTFVIKSLQNNVIQEFIGGTSVQYYETLSLSTVSTGLQALTGFECRGGWLFIANGTTVGQRGVIYADVWSDHNYGNSAVVSSIQYVPPGTLFKYINSLEQLFDRTSSSYFWVRSAPTAGDATFNTAQIPTLAAPGNWTLISTAADLQSVALGPFFQICLTFITLELADQTPAQINDLAYSYILPGEASEKWAPSVENTTRDGVSPMYVAWRLQISYATSVPTLFVRGYDDSGSLVASFNSVTNASAFSFTTNNGTSWSALGTIPNTALTTEVRVLVATPPVASRINWSLSET